MFPEFKIYCLANDFCKDFTLCNRKHTIEDKLGTCNCISFVGSAPLRVCRNQEILIHKTFEELVERGKCSMEWFFGF